MRAASEKETILIVALERAQARLLERELHSGGYRVQTSLGAAEAQEQLARSEGRIQIIVVSAVHRASEGRHGKQPAEVPLDEGCGLCRAVKTAADPLGIAVLFITSVWAGTGLAEGLDTGADYFLFAPYPRDLLLLSVRHALLNSVSEASRGGGAEATDGVEVIHQDRVHQVAAGRARLARLSFSLFEEVRQLSSALFWSRSEAGDLRRQLAQQKQQAQTALELPEAVQGIAHDFSNLLETVDAAATVLRGGPAQPTPYFAALDAAITQMGTLIEVLQNWTGWEEESARREGVDPAVVVAGVLEAALLPMKAPQIRVRVRTQGLPLIWTNRALLFRSISNLVWNAAEAMPAGGILSIAGYVRRNRVLLEVSDTGVGIAQENEQRIFSPHFSTKQGHSGMGLFVVRSLVLRSGGEISFVRRRSGGSTFVLSFPVPSSSVRVRLPATRRRHALAGGQE